MTESRFTRQSRRLLFQFFGGDSWSAIFGAILFLIAIGWLADSLAELLKACISNCWSRLNPSLALLVLAAAVMTVILALARRDTRDDVFHLRQLPAPKLKALILFASRPSDKEIEMLAGLEGQLGDPAFRAAIGATNPVRMPVEAIAHHLATLESLVILDSKERDSRTPGVGGSFEFRAGLAGLLRKWGLPARVKVRYADDFDPAKRGGIDFFSLQEVFDVTQQVYLQLLSEGLPPEEILIDVSGGTKFTSCAGASVALGERRSYQYVHTHTYQVLACNPEYDPAPKA